MDLETLEKLFDRLPLPQLETLRDRLIERINQLHAEAAGVGPEGSRELRQESRFTTRIHGSLRRITDVTEGQKTEYPAEINDVSRSGMRLQVAHSFIMSRVVEVTFQSPSGKMKTVLLEVMRLRRIGGDLDKRTELGCRSISVTAVNKLLAQEKQQREIKAILEQRRKIQVFVVGLVSGGVKRMANTIWNEGYAARVVDTLQRVVETPPTKLPKAVVLWDAEALLQLEREKQAFNMLPADVARVAVCQNEEQKKALLQQGWDEALTRTQAVDWLARSVERALMTRILRLRTSDRPRVLVISKDSVAVNMLSYHFQEEGLLAETAESLEQVGDDQGKMPLMVLADYNPQDPETFRLVRARFSSVPVVALCGHLADGNAAMTCGAQDYLSLPIKEEPLKQLLKAILPTHAVC